MANPKRYSDKIERRDEANTSGLQVPAGSFNLMGKSSFIKPLFEPHFKSIFTNQISQEEIIDESDYSQVIVDPSTKGDFNILSPFRLATISPIKAFIFEDADENSVLVTELAGNAPVYLMYESTDWYFISTDDLTTFGYVLKSAVEETNSFQDLNNVPENLSEEPGINDSLDLVKNEEEGFFNYHGMMRKRRADIDPFKPLTSDQVQLYPWDEAVDVFSQEYKVGVDITQKTFDQWVRRNLIDGWQPGDKAYRINDPAWEVGKKDELWVIDAESSGDAFAYMNKKSGVGIYYYWRRRISGQLSKRVVVFDPAGNAGHENNYIKALENGFIGSPESFEQLYDGSYELYEASLIAVYGEAVVHDFKKAVKDGFVGTIDKFLRLFEGKYSVYSVSKSLFTGENVDDIDETGLNQRMQVAKAGGTVIETFKKEVFDLAVVRLKRNIERIGQWRTYVLSLSPDNLYEAGKTTAYIGLKNDAVENDRQWLLNQWLDQPNPNIRRVQELFITGNFKGGGQFCHSMNNALQMPDITTETPLQQLSDLRPAMPSDTGTVWGYTEAPRNKLSAIEVQDLTKWINSLPENSTGNAPANTTTPATGGSSKSTVAGSENIYPNIKAADDIVGQLNQVLSVLGPHGYNVIPLDVFTDQQDISAEEMRTQIVTAIDGRIIDYNGLIKDVEAGEIKITELLPVTDDLINAITDEKIKDDIHSYISTQQKIETAKNIGKVVISIAALLVGVPPLLVAAAWISEGVGMITHGSSLAQGEGATDVMDPSTVAAGKQMILDGAFIIVLSLFDVAAIASTLTKGTSKLPSVVTRTEGGVDYVIVSNGSASAIVRQPGVTNQYLRLTRNYTTQMDVCEVWTFNRTSKLWELEKIESRPWGTGTTNTSPVASNKKVTTDESPATQGTLPKTTGLSESKSIYGQRLTAIGEPLLNGNVIGKYSGREFDPNKCGGPILQLDWKNAIIEREGIVQIEEHLSRFEFDAWNSGMIKRLNDIDEGIITVTDYDLRFYTHELREFERFKNLGYEKGEFPDWVWENAHAATLEDFKVNEIEIISGDKKIRTLYHPDIQNQ